MFLMLQKNPLTCWWHWNVVHWQIWLVCLNPVGGLFCKIVFLRLVFFPPSLVITMETEDYIQKNDTGSPFVRSVHREIWRLPGKHMKPFQPPSASARTYSMWSKRFRFFWPDRFYNTLQEEVHLTVGDVAFHVLPNQMSEVQAVDRSVWVPLAALAQLALDRRQEGSTDKRFRSPPAGWLL